MKKLILTIMLLCLCFLSFKPSNNVFAESQYARASSSINLYKSVSNDNISNILCLVEKSYFVEIISELDNFYRVNYNGITGYVKRNEVTKVNKTPSTPFPYNIKIIINNTCNLRSSPTNKSQTNNVINTINSGESDITFIGRIFSDEAIDFGGTTWYYVKYKDNYGYIYNKYIKSITPIYENTEISTKLEESSDKLTNTISHTPSIFIIAILFIPCILILLILYSPKISPHKLKSKKKHKTIEKY